MDACNECPHANDCLKVGDCLDELNAPFIRVGATPRLMTSQQAAATMAALRERRTLKRFTSGGKFGTPIVSLKKVHKHCSAYLAWGAEARRLTAANAKAADALKSRIAGGVMHCMRGHSLLGARIYIKDGFRFRFCLECRKIHDAKGGILKPKWGRKLKSRFGPRAPRSAASRLAAIGPSRFPHSVAGISSSRPGD
jgi:hypothetical protein